MKININLAKFNEILEQTARETFNDIGGRIQDELTEENREYPRQTIRKYGRGITGKIANSSRDVVDSENLVNSFNIDRQKYKATYSYKVSYAIFVYMGYSVKSGTKVPPYPWIMNAINKMDIAEIFKINWETK